MSSCDQEDLAALMLPRVHASRDGTYTVLDGHHRIQLLPPSSLVRVSILTTPSPVVPAALIEDASLKAQAEDSGKNLQADAQ